MAREHFPIMIGMFEAASIDRRIKSDFKPPRPLTHDLVVKVAETLGAVVESVLICDMREHTYFAKLQLRRGEELIEVDSRPSDALAVAVTYDPPLPIFVAGARFGCCICLNCFFKAGRFDLLQ